MPSAVNVGMEKGKNPLPARILILLDRLSNVQFSQLTRKQLKDQVEELKSALIEEFAKFKPGLDRPQPSPPNRTAEVTNRSKAVDTPNNIAINTASRKDVPRDDKKQVSRHDKGHSNKETTSKPPKIPVAAKPSYADLLKIAESVRKEPSPPQTLSREKAALVNEEHRRNGSHGSKVSNKRPQSPPRSHINQVPRQDSNRDEKSRISRPNLSSGNDSKSVSKGNYDQPSRSSQHRSGCKNGPIDSKRSRNSGSVDEKQRSGKDQPKKGREPKKSRKEEEEELLERKRQKIREENERVRIRNEVLAGKRSATDLKNVVKQVSHGNTVLSCRPASSNSTSRRENFGRPLVSRTDEGRHRRPVAGGEIGADYEEEEEDEDMESFIDDDDGREEGSDNPDVSKAIRDIFGYDKRKYVGMDEDVEEASYSQILKKKPGVRESDARKI